MKKIYMILAVIAALTMTAQAQNSGVIMVDDGTSTFYNGSYFDMAPTNFYLAHTGAQLIYTPDLLADMDGKEDVNITNLCFSYYSESYEIIVRDVKIYVQESDATEFAVNDDGVKQFFTSFGKLVYDGQEIADLLTGYGTNGRFVFDFDEPFAFTPGKSLIVTIVFDAEDDDNCTMGSDYAPFYTSGIRGKGMTYTDNWDSFLVYAEGDDFPNATATLGCGTNVELPYTEIGYTYEDAPVPGEQTAAPGIVVLPDEMVYDVTITSQDPEADIYYQITYPDGTMSEWTLYKDVIHFDENGIYTVEAYAIAPGKAESVHVSATFEVQVVTGIAEMTAGKQVAGVRYFNMAGQEMPAANGMTIVVTTYTDGTTSAVKVVK